MDTAKLHELVRVEAHQLFDVCDVLPHDCQPAILLAMVHVAKAVEDAGALDGIDRIADRPLRDAELQLLKINDWMYRYAIDFGGLPASGDTATIAVATLDYMHREMVAKDEAYWEANAAHKREIADLRRQLDAANSRPVSLSVTVPGLPGVGATLPSIAGGGA